MTTRVIPTLTMKPIPTPILLPQMPNDYLICYPVIVKRILISNDDGIHADGLWRLRRALLPLGEVVVVAPERPRSGASHAITLHKPLRLKQARLGDGSAGFSCSGTPSDCVTLALSAVMNNQCDLVVSGINHGPNMGWDVFYSGTIAAAMEGTMFGFPSIAVSTFTNSAICDYDAAEVAVARVAELVLLNGIPTGTLININAPSAPWASVKGLKLSRMGRRQYQDRVDHRQDPRGGSYYWLTGTPVDTGEAEDSDVHVVHSGYVAVTPLQMNLSDDSLLEKMNEWSLE